ncbi:MAG: tetratricopeptide repeat protein, partial [Clostridium sp.]|uniref:tetratricopeptide repeat protein n=1 Tax=Clostridium sp. TaxID=1506 RepID=UPI003EE5B9AD
EEKAKLEAEAKKEALKAEAEIKVATRAKEEAEAKLKAAAKAKEEAEAKLKNSSENKTSTEKSPVSPKIEIAKPSKVTSHTSFNKKVVAIVIAAVVVVAGGIGIYAASSSSSKKNETPQVTAPKVDWTNFNTSMQNAISSDNYNELATLLSKAPENEVPSAEKASYTAGLKLMQDSGIQYFYDQGMNDYSNKNYQAAINNFQKALPFANGNYLAPHLTYFMGASYSALGDHAKAVEYYKLYLKNFPNDNIYNSGCLYVLAKYYFAQGHVQEAQTYAKELQSQFPNSEYNNSDIQNILNAK